ncbi:MAG: helix-turn-helix domain-containing protein [Burkholderiales bacterium]|nr:helix-turn-helix domain-containing protein [Burkholderiales bacterium]
MSLVASLKTTYLRQNERFLAQLRAARKNAGVSQQALAKRLRRPQSFVSKYENAERRLDVVEFLQVAQAIGIDPHKVIDGLLSEEEPQLLSKLRRAR